MRGFFENAMIRALLKAPWRAVVMARSWYRGMHFSPSGEAFKKNAAASRSAGTGNIFRDAVARATVDATLFKWEHYFEIYQKHLEKYRHCDVRVLEIGVLGGGSLRLWREALGTKCRVWGVDIDPECVKHETTWCRVFVGDQGDVGFWRRIVEEIEAVDIVIDDGSHVPEDQIITFEQTWEMLRPGGVYICEDIHGKCNTVVSYFFGLAASLNGYDAKDWLVAANTVQSEVESISIYPFCVVITKRSDRVVSFTAKIIGGGPRTEEAQPR